MIRLSPVLVLAAATLASCQSSGSAGSGSQVVPASASGVAPAPDSLRKRPHPADVQFIRDMLAHHAQALTMTAMVPSRSSNEKFQLLAERMDVSQRDEIRLMQQWLRQHGEPVPSSTAHGHHAGPSHDMPGMLTRAELDSLSRTTGREFEQMFLRLMIRHHEGAITMVQRLFGTNGAGQDSEIYAFATDVDNDQRAEIARMRALLDTSPTR